MLNGSGGAAQAAELADHRVRAGRNPLPWRLASGLGGRSGPLHREGGLVARSQLAHIGGRLGEAVGIRPQAPAAVERVHQHLLQTRAEITLARGRADVRDDDRELGFLTHLVVGPVRGHPHGERLVRALPGGDGGCARRRGTRGRGGSRRRARLGRPRLGRPRLGAAGGPAGPGRGDTVGRILVRLLPPCCWSGCGWCWSRTSGRRRPPDPAPGRRPRRSGTGRATRRARARPRRHPRRARVDASRSRGAAARSVQARLPRYVPPARGRRTEVGVSRQSTVTPMSPTCPCSWTCPSESL